MLNSNIQEKLFIYLGLVVLLAVLGRLVHLQLIEGDRYERFVESQINANLTVTKNRGIVYDSEGKVLAENKSVASLFAYKRDINSKREFVNSLNQNGIRLSDKAVEQLSKGNGFVWISRHLDMKTAERVLKSVPELGFYIEEARYYPEGNLMSNMLGYTGIDNQGRAGLEYALNDTLQGEKILVEAINDSRGKSILFENKSVALRPDSEVHLTVSKRVQAVAENILREGAKKFGAKDGVAVAINVKTGDIIFAATVHTFNPHNYAEAGKLAYKNHPFTYLFEPGSIFKSIAFAYMFENNMIDFKKLYDTTRAVQIGGFQYTDTKNYGIINPEDIFTHSSNIGMVKMVKDVKKESYYNYLAEAGFGKKTGIYGVKEESGVLKPAKTWSQNSKNSISIGYEILVTPIQMARFYAAIANGGVMVTPRVVSSVKVGMNNMVVTDSEKRIMSKSTANSLLRLLVKTVEEGTGRNAYTDIVKVAGKTGTSKKYDRVKKEYSNTEYSASFAGVFPADKPEIAMIVLFEAPSSSIFGGATAANVFKNLAEYLSVELRIFKDDVKVANVKN